MPRNIQALTVPCRCKSSRATMAPKARAQHDEHHHSMRTQGKAGPNQQNWRHRSEAVKNHTSQLLSGSGAFRDSSLCNITHCISQVWMSKWQIVAILCQLTAPFHHTSPFFYIKVSDYLPFNLVLHPNFQTWKYNLEHNAKKVFLGEKGLFVWDYFSFNIWLWIQIHHNSCWRTVALIKGWFPWRTKKVKW